MTNTIQLKDLRKELKTVGFNIATKSFSFGVASTIFPNDCKELKWCNVIPKEYFDKYNYSAMNEVVNKYKGFTLVDSDGDKIMCSLLR